MLAKNKSNSVKSGISKALLECHILEKDYAFINDGVDRYNKSKEKLFKNAKSQLIDFRKKFFIDYGFNLFYEFIENISNNGMYK